LWAIPLGLFAKTGFSKKALFAKIGFSKKALFWKNRF
jgi:hypothetical protein